MLSLAYISLIALTSLVDNSKQTERATDPTYTDHFTPGFLKITKTNRLKVFGVTHDPSGYTYS